MPLYILILNIFIFQIANGLSSKLIDSYAPEDIYGESYPYDTEPFNGTSRWTNSSAIGEDYAGLLGAGETYDDGNGGDGDTCFSDDQCLAKYSEVSSPEDMSMLGCKHNRCDFCKNEAYQCTEPDSQCK
ncbi:uncharacterized protein LOC111702599 [Eurytemora carolleeae]|uniref:uncharacterized protein LOC111702599 n=1 Tax=Eurytemora carolleeae TaxID=1294199 RepID=UPI000C77707D|nr:uncharacterized protein LOC111702599 [Eurytemora carolleeae]|eukprot:XP_023330107.1 uncharacterized protein LOC111702599 [Eurytemora affinis]